MKSFVPSGSHSIAAKAKIFTRLCAFVESDFAKKKFPYEELRCLFGHIAHTDRDGFYDHWFETPEKRYAWTDFVLSFHAEQRIEDRNRADFTDCDVEKAFQEWLAPRQGALEKVVQERLETAERAELARLKAKYDEGTTQQYMLSHDVVVLEAEPLSWTLDEVEEWEK